MNTSTLIEKLNNYINYHKLTLPEFCDLTKISIETINKIINKEHYVCLHDLMHIAKILNIDILDILY